MTLEYPADLLYLDSHEYIKLDGDTATIGVTAFAVDQLGDVVFIEVPEVGKTITQGEVMGTIESVKAVEDLYAPISGTVIATNQTIMDAPEQLATDPYQQGWLLQVQVAAGSTPDKTLSAEDYRKLVEGS